MQAGRIFAGKLSAGGDFWGPSYNGAPAVYPDGSHGYMIDWPALCSTIALFVSDKSVSTTTRPTQRICKCHNVPPLSLV